jgi:hypothetical protein
LEGAHPLDMLEEALAACKSPSRMRRFAAEVCRALGREDAAEKLLRVAEGTAQDRELDRLRGSSQPGRAVGYSYRPYRINRRDQILGVVLAAAAESEYEAAWGAAVAAMPLLQRELIPLVQCQFPNPLRSPVFDASFRTTTAVSLARLIDESQDFSTMPILADALQDAGCDGPDILAHCLGPGPHTRGCWVAHLLLGKE